MGGSNDNSLESLRDWALALSDHDLHRHAASLADELGARLQSVGRIVADSEDEQLRRQWFAYVDAVLRVEALRYEAERRWGR